MGADLYERFPTFRAVLDSAAARVDFDLKEVSFTDAKGVLNQTRYTQPCMVAFAAGMTALLAERGIIPAAAAGDALAERFRTVEFREPQIPVIFNCLGAERPDGTAIPELLVRQVQSSVYMEDSLRRMAAMGLDALVEIGPGKALSGFVKKTVPELPVYAVETAAELEQLTETIKGASL